MYTKLGAVLACGLLCGILGTSAASAQVAGTYAGTSADGQSISISVTFDSGTGLYEITGATVWYNVHCTGLGTGITINEGLGWNPGTELNPGANQMTFSGNEENIFANLGWHKYSNAFTGNIDTRIAALVPNGAARPNHVMYCESASQPLTLTYQGPSHFQPLPKGAVIRLPAKQE